MTSWQKWVRIALAVFLVAFAGAVYVSIRTRQVQPAPPAVQRLDPKAVAETTDATLEQVRGVEPEFEVTSSRSLSYEDGSVKHVDARITVRRPDRRVYTLTAREALAGPNQMEFELTGGVTLSIDDGFSMWTEHGTFGRADGIARADGEVMFTKGRMSGSGRGASYDQHNDVLKMSTDARIVVTDAAGRTTLEGQADSVTLDRSSHSLFLDSAVHVLRGAQVIQADRGLARLSASEEVINFLELRGHARVDGGESDISSMSADGIDLDYTDDGATLERVVLNHGASVSTVAREGRASHMSGESLDVHLASDGSIAALTGRDGVGFDLAGTPARSITAQTLNADGEPGRGLTAARFQGAVVFRETGDAAASVRRVSADALSASLDGQDVTNAFFAGHVSFTDGSLRATANEAQYRPGSDQLNLAGPESGGSASVSDEQIRVDARTVVVTLSGHAMNAQGQVRTTFTGRTARSGDGRLPGLLRANQASSVNAQSLDYSGSSGRAVFTGEAALLQGDTAIRAHAIILDQARGDLMASGSARSTLALDAGRTDGRADVIRYEEAARTVTYSDGALAPTSGEGAATAPHAQGGSAGSLAQLTGPDGDLRARRIQIVLAKGANAVDRLEAFDTVTITLGSRTASGTRLTYYAGEERYVMTGEGARPVSIRESCRETTGRTLTFFKSGDRVIVDGNETGRTETKPCGSPSAR